VRRGYSGGPFRTLRAHACVCVELCSAVAGIHAVQFFQALLFCISYQMFIFYFFDVCKKIDDYVV